jgi:hypothetical protein
MTNKASCQTAKRKSVTLGLDGVGEKTKAGKKANIIFSQLHCCSATMNIKPCADVLQMRGEDHIEAASPEVKIVDAPAVHLVRLARRSSYSEDEDEVQIVGIVKECRLPHMAPHCAERTYQRTSNYAMNACAQTKENERSCDLCYCYVCDIKVAACKEWSCHCNATDQGPTASYWKKQRRRQKNFLSMKLHPSVLYETENSGLRRSSRDRQAPVRFS